MGAALRRVPGVLTIAGTQDAGTEGGQSWWRGHRGNLSVGMPSAVFERDGHTDETCLVLCLRGRGAGSRSINLFACMSHLQAQFGSSRVRLCVAGWFAWLGNA